MKVKTILIKIKHKTRVRTRVKNFIKQTRNKCISIFNYLILNYKRIFGRFYKKQIIFIIGVQRSGTNALLRNLSKDKRIKTYTEFSELSEHGDEKLRLHPLPILKKQIESNTQPIILIKPLVETQNTRELLSNFSGSRAIWIYRHYRDVASSNLKNFGINNGFNDLKPVIDGDYSNWRAEGVADDVRSIVTKFMDKDLLPHDAAALFWYMRSRFYFDLELDKRDDVLLLKYEDFVQNPTLYFKRIYQHIKFDMPKYLERSSIHNNSVAKGASIPLSEDVVKLCDSLYEKFESHYKSK